MQKYYVMAIKQRLWKNALYIQSILEKILPIIFVRGVRLTKHFVDQVLANYNGYYMQGSGKSDQYGFFWCLLDMDSMRIDVFLTFSPKFKNLSRFSLSNCYF